MKKSILLSCLCYFVYSVSAVTVLPVTLARGRYDAVGTTTPDYFKVTPCLDSVQTRTAVLSIAVPDNTNWNVNKPFLMLELSVCNGTFNADCVFATNYIWGSTPVAFAQIVWDWTNKLDAYGSFYIRALSRIKSVEYSFEINFVSNSAFTAGTYSPSAFPQSSVPSNAVFNPLMQYITLRKPDTVNNYETKTYFVKFCTKDISSSSNPEDLSVIATVQSSPTRPMSLFNLYGCSIDVGPSCGTFSFNVADEISTSVAQVELSADTTPSIVDGMYFTVYGIGGEQDQINEYYFNVRACWCN